MIHALNPKGAVYKFFNAVPFILQIIIGMILGILLAFFVPEGQAFISLLGDLFVCNSCLLGTYFFS